MRSFTPATRPECAKAKPNGEKRTKAAASCASERVPPEPTASATLGCDADAVACEAHGSDEKKRPGASGGAGMEERSAAGAGALDGDGAGGAATDEKTEPGA